VFDRAKFDVLVVKVDPLNGAEGSVFQQTVMVFVDRVPRLRKRGDEEREPFSERRHFLETEQIPGSIDANLFGAAAKQMEQSITVEHWIEMGAPLREEPT